MDFRATTDESQLRKDTGNDIGFDSDNQTLKRCATTRKIRILMVIRFEFFFECPNPLSL